MKGALLNLAAATFVSLAAAQNCNLLVPPNPLSATGLATPYVISTTTAANGLAAASAVTCSQLLPNAQVFVEATILDATTGAMTVYYPLVVDNKNPKAVGGPAAGATIATPTIPANGVVGIWFGGNNAYTTLTEAAAGTALAPGNCVNGLAAGTTGATLSQFGEFAYCNAVNFFNVANFLIAQGILKVPAPGLTNKGAPCPTVRSFAVVDQDQSDNSLAPYLITSTGQLAQATATNINTLNVIATLVNASDNRLVAGNISPAVGCTPFMAPDNIDGVVTAAAAAAAAANGAAAPTPIMRSSIALNELAAAASGNPNPALVPSYHPMTLTSTTATTMALVGPATGNTPVGQPSLAKINAYRAGVNQPPLAALDSPNDVINYCENMLAETGPFLALHAVDLSKAPSLVPALASNLLALLAVRFGAAYGTLGCATLTGLPNPILAFDPLGNPFNGMVPAATTNIAALYPAEALQGGFIAAVNTL